jgi:Holliday junction resolvase RusA-like endonuclease
VQKIIVEGQPQGKLRARHGKNFITGAPQTYTPEKTRAYEAHIAWSYKAQGGRHYGDSYVRLGVLAFYSIPKIWTKAKQQQAREGALRPSVKPDADNIIKAAADALNGVAYTDDTQVVEVFARKYYSDSPRIEIYIEAAATSSTEKEAKK